MPLLLLFAVFVIATCGLIYELVAGTLASYLLGDSVTQFSTIIGVYLFSMGIGSYLSKFFKQNLLSHFIRIELIIGLVGGFSSVVLFLLFPLAANFQLLLYAIVSLTGILVGLEIPLLMRILKDKVEFSELVSKVFTFDYIGALLASLVFPLVLVPQLGLIRTSLFFGILNIAVGFFLLVKLEKEIKNASFLRIIAGFLICAEVVAFAMSDRILTYSESLAYSDNIIYAKSSPYQRIVITRNKRETRLFLNGNLQFSSADEYRYHEALVHPGLQAHVSPKKVLVLGGGDGLAVREILKNSTVEQIVLVDLDPAITSLFSSSAFLTKLNDSSLHNARVSVINKDAFLYLRDNQTKFDFVVIDFPDPSNFSIGKLYSNTFYKLLKENMADDAMAVIQSTSPFVAPKAFSCINFTLQSVGFKTIPYHNMVPSFGDWGYILVTKDTQYQLPASFPKNLKFVNRETMQQMMHFPPDMQLSKYEQVNKLNNQVLVDVFEEEWNHYLQ